MSPRVTGGVGFVCTCGAWVEWDKPHTCYVRTDPNASSPVVLKSFTPVIAHAGTQWVKLCAVIGLDPDAATWTDALGKRNAMFAQYEATQGRGNAADVERTWQEFWREIVEGATWLETLENVKRELFDYRVILSEVPKVYDQLTNGRITKPNAAAGYVIDANTEAWEQWRKDAEADERAERLPRVYVAGPYTHGDVAHNVRAAIFCGDWLAQRGCVPFVPHLSHFAHLLCPRPYEYWIEQDLAWLRVCDALVRLPGESQGADGEVAQARVLGLPVFMWPAEGECVKGFAAWREGWGK